jgi:hypothetical protein
LNWAIRWFVRYLLAAAFACTEVVRGAIAAHASEADEARADETEEAGHEAFVVFVYFHCLHTRLGAAFAVRAIDPLGSSPEGF